MAGPITGQLGAFAQPGHWGRSDTGNYSVLVYEGSKQEVTNLAANIAQTLGLTYDVTESFGKFRLEVHYPWNYTANNAATDVVILWELFANHSEKDLLEAKLEAPALIGTLSQAQIQAIRHYLQTPVTSPRSMTIPDPDNPDDTISASVDVLVPLTVNFFNQLPPDPTGSIGYGNATNALAVYSLMMQGIRSHPIAQPILRRTMVTSQNYALALALTNVRKIISTASLISLEQVDTSSLFYDPSNGQLLLPEDLSPDPALAYGWYKVFPTAQQVARLKWQIVQEWQYGLWATPIWGSPL